MEQHSIADDGSDESLLARFNRHLAQQLNLCDALEKIADDLPNAVNKQACLQVARAIHPTIKSAHDFEEHHLFPKLPKAQTDPLQLEASLERLRGEHWEDESFGDDLADSLKGFVSGQEINVDKLAYMLRGFFDGLRRHIAFEQEMIVPLLYKSN